MLVLRAPIISGSGSGGDILKTVGLRTTVSQDLKSKAVKWRRSGSGSAKKVSGPSKPIRRPAVPSSTGPFSRSSCHAG